jgi:hypothetical protein
MSVYSAQTKYSRSSSRSEIVREETKMPAPLFDREKFRENEEKHRKLMADNQKRRKYVTFYF